MPAGPKAVAQKRLSKTRHALLIGEYRGECRRNYMASRVRTPPLRLCGVAAVGRAKFRQNLVAPINRAA